MAFDAGSIVSTLEVNRTPFQQGIAMARKEGRDFASQKYTATLGFDNTKAMANAKAVREAVKGLAGTRTLNVNVNVGKGRQDLQQMLQLVERLDGKTATVGLATKGAEAAYSDVYDLSRVVSELDRKRATVHVGVDGAGTAVAELGGVDSAVAALDGKRAQASVDVDTSRAHANVRMLAVAIMALGPALIPIGGVALGALGAFGTGAAVAVPALGATMLGVSGVSDAVKALSEQQKASTATSASAARSAAAAARQQESAASSLRSAERGLANARATAAEQARSSQRAVENAYQQAAEGVARALERQRDANRAYSAAVRDEARAQAEVNAAREEARRSIEDLQFSVLGGALAERRAVLQLQKATDDLNAARAAGMNGRAMEEVTLSYEEAKLSLDELRVRNGRLAEEKAAADRQGVEGSRQVIAANERAADAAEKVAEADRDRQRAAEEVSRAQREGQERINDALAAQTAQQRASAAAITSALEGVENAQRAVAAAAENTGSVSTAAADKAKEALDKLSPAGQEFARFLVGLEGNWQRLKNTAQEGFLPGAQRGIEALLRQEQPINAFVGSYATAMGRLAQSTGEGLNDQYWVDFFAWLEQQASPTIDQFGRIAGGTFKGLAGVVRGFAPFWYDMGDGLESLTDRFARFGAEVSAGRHKEFNEFLAYVRENGPVVMGVLGDLLRAGVQLAVALAPIGGITLQIVGAFARLIENTPTPILQALAIAITGVLIASKGAQAVHAFSRMLDSIGSAAGKVRTGLDTAGTKVRDFADTMRVGAASMAGYGPASVAAGGAVEGFGRKAADAGGKGGVGKLLSAGGGLLGMLGGPWGLALGAAAVGVGLLVDKLGESSRKAEEARQRQADLRKAIDDANGVIDEQVRSLVEQQLGQQDAAYASGNLQQAATDLGFSMQGLGQAVYGTQADFDGQITKLHEVADQHIRMRGYVDEFGNFVGPKYDEVGNKAMSLASAVEKSRDEFLKQQQESLETRAALNGITVEQQKLNDALQGTIDKQVELATQSLTFRQSKLDLKQAQSDLNAAIAEYGPKSVEAEQAQIRLEQAQLRYIDAARTANGATDGSKQSIDQQRQAILDVVAATNGPLTESVQTFLNNMGTTELAAMGAKFRIDETGRAIAILPDGHEFVLSAPNQKAIDDARAAGQVVADQDGKTATFTLKTNVEPPQPTAGGRPADTRSWWQKLRDAIFGAPDSAPVVPGLGTGKPGGGGYKPYAGGGIVRGAGGVLPGFEPGLDRVPALLSRGEAVLVPELVRAIGPDTILALNAQYSRGRRPGSTGGRGARFAGGGVIGAAGGAVVAASPAPAAGGEDLAAGAPVSPDTTAAAAEAVTALAGAVTVLNPLTTAMTAASQLATGATDAQTAAAQNLTATGLNPLVAQLTGQTFPALTEAARLAGTVDVAALQALQAQHPPTQDAFVRTGQVVAQQSAGVQQQLQAMADKGTLVSGSLQGSLAAAQQSFMNTAQVAGVQFGILQRNIADPVRWSMQFPLGDPGIIGAWNALDGAFQLNKHLTAYMPRFAVGGAVSGGGTATSDDVPAMLSTGEHVWTAAEVRGAGGHGAVQDLRKLAAAGLINDLAHFAEGGPVYQQLYRMAKARFPDTILTSGQRNEPGSYHHIGAAADLVRGNMRELDKWIGETYPGSSELIHTPGPYNIKDGRAHTYSAGVQADHFDHVHWAVAPGRDARLGTPGGGLVMDMGALVSPYFDDTRRLIGDITRFHGQGVASAGMAGLATQAVDTVQAKGVDLLNARLAMGGGGGDVERWRPVVNTALAMVGQPLSAADFTLRRMNQESGGDPNVVNRWDINWIKGHPSVGLMQVIGPTYRSNRDPRHDVGPYLYGTSVDPLSNVLASMHYALRTYGSLAAAYNKAGGYADGAVVDSPTLGIFGEAGPEALIPLSRPARAAEVMREAGLTGSGVDADRMLAALEAMTARIEAAVAAARPINVHPRERQSEESIAASIRRREELDRRVTT